MRDHYEVLGIESKATEAEIRKAWIQGVKRNHPDRNPTAHEKFLAVMEAYDVLSEAESRAVYGRALAAYEEEMGIRRRRNAWVDLIGPIGVRVYEILSRTPGIEQRQYELLAEIARRPSRSIRELFEPTDGLEVSVSSGKEVGLRVGEEDGIAFEGDGGLVRYNWDRVVVDGFSGDVSLPPDYDLKLRLVARKGGSLSGVVAHGGIALLDGASLDLHVFGNVGVRVKRDLGIDVYGMVQGSDGALVSSSYPNPTRELTVIGSVKGGRITHDGNDLRYVA